MLPVYELHQRSAESIKTRSSLPSDTSHHSLKLQEFSCWLSKKGDKEFRHTHTLCGEFELEILHMCNWNFATRNFKQLGGGGGPSFFISFTKRALFQHAHHLLQRTAFLTTCTFRIQSYGCRLATPSTVYCTMFNL